MTAAAMASPAVSLRSVRLPRLTGTAPASVAKLNLSRLEAALRADKQAQSLRAGLLKPLGQRLI